MQSVSKTVNPLKKHFCKVHKQNNIFLQKEKDCKSAGKFVEPYLHLGERVLVGGLEQDGDGLRVAALLHEGELVLAQDVLVHKA